MHSHSQAISWCSPQCSLRLTLGRQRRSGINHPWRIRYLSSSKKLRREHTLRCLYGVSHGYPRTYEKTLENIRLIRWKLSRKLPADMPPHSECFPRLLRWYQVVHFQAKYGHVLQERIFMRRLSSFILTSPGILSNFMWLYINVVRPESNNLA